MASARIVAAVSAEASSTAHPIVCAVLNSAVWPLLITVVLYFRCPAKTVGFSGTHLYLCVYNQPS